MIARAGSARTYSSGGSPWCQKQAPVSLGITSSLRVNCYPFLEAHPIHVVGDNVSLHPIALDDIAASDDVCSMADYCMNMKSRP